MQELEILLKNGRHVEFVDTILHTKEILYKMGDRKDNDVKIWFKNYIKNKEILSLTDQQLVDLSCVLGVYFAKREQKLQLKTTQIRKLLTRFNKIEEDKENFNRNDIIKLKPILAYTSARNEPTKDLIKILDNSINKIRDGKEGYNDFKKICDFLRGVVAYHRLAGGSD
ncbi:MAG: type III-A CRISPR-associated protein Csm2 [Candidatus Methanoperedens sp.]|nr:type III-A CRISPR-associated protein Csm2 [Candidatus Methanoperedens sp.]MCZ7405293.1 type III-A CRISPR-associated protein Csm2 [Candidatus Methanoperedens sp.]